MIADSPRLDADTRAAVLRLADRARAHDGVGPLSEQALLAVRSDATGAWRHLTVTAGDEVAGYAFEEAPPEGEAAVEIVVDPQRRRRGAGSDLLAASASAHPDVRVWAHGFLPEAREFARARDLGVVRELWLMTMAPGRGPATPEIDLPDGFVARTFEVGRDERAWLEVNAAAFADHPEQGRIDAADLKRREQEPWFDPAGFFLVEDVRGEWPRLAAFHWTKVEDGIGEIYVVGVAPESQGHGLGRAATRLGLRHLRSLGLDRVDLYVDGDNDAAIATYRREGFERAALDVQLTPRSPA